MWLNQRGVCERARSGRRSHRDDDAAVGSSPAASQQPFGRSSHRVTGPSLRSAPFPRCCGRGMPVCYACARVPLEAAAQPSSGSRLFMYPA